MAQVHSHPVVFEIGTIQVEALADFVILNPGCAAQTSGPAERCFPAEPMEIELRSVRLWETKLDVLDAIDGLMANPIDPKDNRSVRDAIETDIIETYDFRQDDRFDG